MRLDIHPFNNIDEARLWACTSIDASAGAARARYLTLAAGQDATYQAKYADALAFRRAGYPPATIDQYPWISQEAAATGASAQATADRILAAGAPWNVVLGPRIEAFRIGGKSTIEGLTTIGEVVSHARQVQRSLSLA